jgi:hypothetical protein
LFYKPFSRTFRTVKTTNQNTPAALPVSVMRDALLALRRRTFQDGAIWIEAHAETEAQ